MRWFKHMTSSADDEKLSRLKDEYGLEGYGFWWSVVEIVAAKIGENAETFTEYSPKKWGNLLGISPKKFGKLAEYCADLGLFFMESSENSIRIDMPNVLKYRDEYTERQHKKSGQCRDNVRPSRARGTDTEADTEAESINTPPPPTGGERVSDPPADVAEKTQTPRHRSTGDNAADLRKAVEAYTAFPELRRALEDFRRMRERIRKPMTARALALLLAKLDALAPDDAEKVAVLEQSILHSWQGIFPVGSQRASPSKPEPDDITRKNMENAHVVLLRRKLKREAEEDARRFGNA